MDPRPGDPRKKKKHRKKRRQKRKQQFKLANHFYSEVAGRGWLEEKEFFQP
jgi:hypothetical protein